MDKLLSICIPTYNRAVCLQECLESILLSAKGFEDKIEINILDNASRDNTEEVVRKYQTRYNFINYKINTASPNENIFKAASLGTGNLYFYIKANGTISFSYRWRIPRKGVSSHS